MMAKICPCLACNGCTLLSSLAQTKTRKGKASRLEVANLLRSLLFLLLSLALSFTQPAAAAAKKRNEMTISVSVSPNAAFVSRLAVEQKSGLARAITHSPTGNPAQEPYPVRATVQIGADSYLLGFDSLFYDRKRKRAVRLSPKTFGQLDSYVSLLEARHYGRPTPWSEARQEFKRMSYATVIDLETGKSFRVQRRAGSRHADVQPLTREDTLIMKQIYQGKWSWKRRAILVRVNGKHYAASMHGMPHGAGGIPGNQFPGHFCIHFQGSSTHRKTEPDPGHSLMILKASGKLYEAIQTADPRQLVDYFLTSLHEHDFFSLKVAAGPYPLPPFLENIDSIKRQNELDQWHDDASLTAEIPVRVSFFYRQGPEQKELWTFSLVRLSPLDPWRICSITAE
ncbi:MULTISPECIES: hypothetical protein [Brevibacillus]|jgi:hypothetical protein|uniref:hypothetical protein n=1 Tax=Brevibacillus TaxID=55080 RepID=UPI0030D32CB9